MKTPYESIRDAADSDSETIDVVLSKRDCRDVVAMVEGLRAYALRADQPAPTETALPAPRTCDCGDPRAAHSDIYPHVCRMRGCSCVAFSVDKQPSPIDGKPIGAKRYGGSTTPLSDFADPRLSHALANPPGPRHARLKP